MLTSLRNRFTADWRQIDWPRTGLLVLLILALFAAGWQYAMPEVRTITTTVFKRVPEIRTVHDVQRVRVACPEAGIVVLDKQEVAEKLHIDWLRGGDVAAPEGEVTPPSEEGIQPGATPPPDLQVTATAEIPETDSGAEAVSLIDLNTGESTIVVREKPAPWFALENHGSLSGWYGYNQHLLLTGDIDGRWQFLRIKDMHLGLRTSGGTDGELRFQLGTIYQW